MQKHIVSIIVPIYNVKQYLVEAIESLTAQLYTSLEIILIDDGSTDGSSEICDLYHKNNERVLAIHQENKGLSAAKNIGLDICNGDLIAFLDPDDAFCPNMISEMLSVLDESGADMVECNSGIYKNVNKMNPEIINKMPRFIPSKQSRTGLYQRYATLHMQLNNLISPVSWNKLYKRKLWDGLRFPEGQNFEDYDIILPLLERTDSVFILDQPLVMHRIRNDSITKTLSLKNMQDQQLAFTHYFEYIKSHTPEYFDIKDQQAFSIKQYSFFIDRYFYYHYYNSKIEKEYLDYLRILIHNAREAISTKDLPAQIRLETFFYFHVPSFISIALYNKYMLIKDLLRRVLSR